MTVYTVENSTGDCIRGEGGRPTMAITQVTVLGGRGGVQQWLSASCSIHHDTAV